LDLFIVDHLAWPVQLAIRTGPRNFSRKIVTPRNKGGLLPSDMRIHNGQIWKSNLPVKLESEREFLELCGGWIDPEMRN